ncbi:type IV secretion system DNA-binding domain-containing protein [Spiroplasma sp. hyd1]|uniref:type IV secretion system DNA-binding domain-containing protein n=1 Tax=Spiroplasma sp. hyd1 TaxID=1609976 RepID=UPI0018DC21DD|nr:type IV secretion system DNA-binding domain-containing protein [Spiroplasma sp. hyd1]
MKSLRDKKYLNALTWLTLAMILLVAICLTTNILHPNLTYNWDGWNILGSLFVIELQFLPLFVLLYAILDYCVYLIANKVGAWFNNKNERYEFINIFIKSWIWFLLILKSTSYLTKLLNTRKKVVNKIQQWQNSNVLLDNFTALNKDKLNQHTLLVGTTGSGKTTTLLSIIKQLNTKLKQTTIIIDGKGDVDLIDKVKQQDPNAFIWTINGNLQYNPFATKDSVVLSDKIMSLFDFSEQYYQSMANDYVLILTETLISNKISFILDNIIKYFNIENLKNLVGRDNPNYAYLDNINVKDIGGLRSRLNVYRQQLKTSIGDKNSISEIVKNHQVILFSINSLSYPKLANAVGRLFIQDLKEFATNKPQEQKINIIMDEFNVFASETIVNLINKTRSFNYQVFLSFQTINDLKLKDIDLTDTIFGNTSNVICHSVKDPNTADYLSKVFGTITKAKLTRQLDFANEQSIMGSVRDVEEFIFHPNNFKNLSTGTAIIKIINDNNNISNFVFKKIQVERND